MHAVHLTHLVFAGLGGRSATGKAGGFLTNSGRKCFLCGQKYMYFGLSMFTLSFMSGFGAE